MPGQIEVARKFRRLLTDSEIRQSHENCERVQDPYAVRCMPQVFGAVVGAACLVAAVVFGAYGTALALVGTQLRILPLQLYSLISETGSDFPAAAALALLITAACSSIMATGEWISHRHERHL